MNNTTSKDVSWEIVVPVAVSLWQADSTSKSSQAGTVNSSMQTSGDSGVALLRVGVTRQSARRGGTYDDY